MATSATTGLQFRLLGPLEVLRDHEPLALGGERQRSLLALLLLHANEVVTTETMAGQLFGADASDASVNAVRVAVSRLRRLLDNETLETRPGGYLVRADPEQLDVAEFEALVVQGRTALDGGDPAAAAALFRSALALFRGPPFADLARLDFIQLEVRRLEELRLSALMDRIDADLALGRGGELVPELETLVHASPFQERLRGQLMLALYRSGRQTDALNVYRRTREFLAEELGLEPSRALQQLERAMLQHDPALDVARSAAAPAERATCPFKGLAAFEAADAFYFCGRERLLDEIVGRLASGTFLGIIGPSGVGKSSLLRAGLLPALAAGALPGSATWPVALIRGGDHVTAPVRDAVDTCRLGERVVIAVDQLEEIFGDEVSAEDRSAFFAELERAAADPAHRALVLVAVRADFYGRFADHPGIADRLSRSQVFVRSLDRDELVRAIEVPASRAGLEVERSLVDALVADTADATGALPLLQTTLLQLWAERDGRVLRYDAYRKMAGLRGAVARLAEETFAALPAEDQEIARRVMLRLAGGEDGALVRRRVPLVDVRRLDGAARVVDALVAARLLTVDDELVELSHEALLHEWPRYRRWLEDDRVDRRVHAHLAAGADDWDAGGRDSAELYRGARLSAALELPRTDLTDLEREFLDVGRAEADRELRRQRLHNRRLRLLLAGVGVLFVAAMVGGVVALQKSRTASHDARVELAGRLGNEAVIEPRIDRAMLLAREALNLNRSFQTEGTLLATLLRTPAVTGTYTVPIQDHAQEVKVAPDGRTIAVVTNNNVMRIFDTRTHRQTSTFPAADLDYAYVPTSRNLLVQDPRPIPDLLLEDPRAGRTLRSFTLSKAWENTGSSPDQPMVISRDGRFASLFWTVLNTNRTYGAAYMELWSLDHSGPSHLVPLHSNGLVVAAALPGDRVIAATDRQISTWNAENGQRIHAVRGPRLGSDFVNGAISPNGRMFAYGLADGTVHFFDIAHGREISGVGSHSASVERIAFSPDSRLAVSVGDDGLGIIWNPATGKPVERLTGHVGRVLDAYFNPHGETLYTAGLDGTVLQYDLSGSRRFGSSFALQPGHIVSRTVALPSVPVLASSGNGKLFAASAVNKSATQSSVQIFSVGTLHRVATISLASHRMIGAAAWAGRQFVVGADRGLVQLWSVAGGNAVPGPKLFGLARSGCSSRPNRCALPMVVRSLAAGDGGRVIAAVADWYFPVNGYPFEDGQLAIWRDGRLVAGPLALHTFGNWVTVSPDGSTVAVATDPRQGKADGRVLVVDTRDGQLERTIQPSNAGGGVTAVAFSRDGTLATGTSSGIVQLWDPRTGRTVGRATLVTPAPVASISFSPDGKTFATSGGSTGGIRVWVTATQQQLGSDFPGGDGQWGNVAYTPDGRYLLAVFGDGTAYRWPVSVRAWEHQACAVAGRNFTREEWARYVPHHVYQRVCS